MITPTPAQLVAAVMAYDAALGDTAWLKTQIASTAAERLAAMRAALVAALNVEEPPGARTEWALWNIPRAPVVPGAGGLGGGAA